MASLKDMRVRIAATKATQKITKAMQMVAASKLRRAQAAAEAARPYAESMETVLGNIAAIGGGAGRGAQAARRHRQRPRPSAGRLHRRARAVRPVQLGDRAAGARAGECADGPKARTSSSSASAARVSTSSSGCTRSRSSRPSNCAACARSASNTPRTIGEKIIELFEQGAFDVCTLFFSRFRSVILQIPTALQIIPPVFPEKTEGPARATSTSRTSLKFWTSFCLATSRCRCSARSWRTPPPSRARA